MPVRRGRNGGPAKSDEILRLGLNYEACSVAGGAVAAVTVFFAASFLSDALFTAGFLQAAVFWTVVFATGFSAFFAAAAFLALNAAQRFFVASAMRFRAAGLILRFFGAACAGASSACLTLAHRFFCAAAILRLTAALRFRLVGASATGTCTDVARGARMPRVRRMSCILASTWLSWYCNPNSAASRMLFSSTDCIPRIINRIIRRKQYGL